MLHLHRCALRPVVSATALTALSFVLGCSSNSGGSSDTSNSGGTSSGAQSSTGATSSLTGGNSSTGATGNSTGGNSSTVGSGDRMPLDLGESVAADDFAEAFTKALCTLQVNCMDWFLQKQSYEACLRVQGPEIESSVAVILSDVAEGTIEYDGAAVAECLENWAASCGHTGDVERFCDTFLGTLEQDEPCSSSPECKSGLYCENEETCEGTCQPRIAQGDPCMGRDTFSCQTGFICDGETCVPHLQPGEACDENHSCNSSVCTTDGESARSCHAYDEVPLVEEGGDCSWSGRRYCTYGTHCNLSEKCVASAESGGECELALPDMCPSGEVCIEGTCSPEPHANDSCQTDLECVSYAEHLVCIEGKCIPRRRLGESCTSDASCASDLCVEGKCVATDCE